ncbi:hypothetical protein D554_2676 [Bordetella holmesii 30539]|nr:hypothetical protein D554_2676 [Bordetella holmesii 30539]
MGIYVVSAAMLATTPPRRLTRPARLRQANAGRQPASHPPTRCAI